MQWKLVEGADGKKFLEVYWERINWGQMERLLVWRRPVCSPGGLSPDFPAKNSGLEEQDFSTALGAD
jgi:hypothetical protein